MVNNKLLNRVLFTGKYEMDKALSDGRSQQNVIVNNVFIKLIQSLIPDSKPRISHFPLLLIFPVPILTPGS